MDTPVFIQVPLSGVPGAPLRGLGAGEFRRFPNGACHGLLQFPCGGGCEVAGHSPESLDANAAEELRRGCPCARGGECFGDYVLRQCQPADELVLVAA